VRAAGVGVLSALVGGVLSFAPMLIADCYRRGHQRPNGTPNTFPLIPHCCFRILRFHLQYDGGDGHWRHFICIRHGAGVSSPLSMVPHPPCAERNVVLVLRLVLVSSSKNL